MKYIYLALIALVTVSCGDDNTDENTSPNLDFYGKMTLKMEHVWGQMVQGSMNSEAFALKKEFILEETGDTILFKKFKYYLSNIELTSSSGEVYKVPNSYYLIDLSTSGYVELEIDSIALGEYVDMKFTIGVDSTKNVSGAQTGALSPSNEMFWNWNTGYRFITAEGMANDNMFTYHIGGFSGQNNALQSKSCVFEQSLLVSPDATPQAHFMINVSKLWSSSTPVKDYKMVHMPGKKAVDLAKNFSGAFMLHHSHQ